jgi:hypothetical protein
VTISYESDDTTTTGLGLRIHFDSNAITLASVSDILTSDNITPPSASQIFEDSSDYDNNPETDSYVVANWASLFGQWPGSSPVELFTLIFEDK